MSCKSCKNNDKNHEEVSGKSEISVLSNQSFLLKIILFAFSVPLTVLLLPVVWVMLFKHFFLGSGINLSKIVKKLFFIKDKKTNNLSLEN